MAIARVQSVSVTTVASTVLTSTTITLGSPTTTGNTVIVAIATTSNRNIKVTSAHGIFSNVNPTAIDTTTAVCMTMIYYGVMTGADTVITIATIDATALGATSIVAAEYSGALIIPDNIPAIVNASAVNACNTGNLANLNANALYVGTIGVKMQSSTTNTAWASNNIAPFSIVAQNTTNVNSSATSDRAIVYLDAIVATATTRGANVNHGFGTNRYAGVLATFDQGISAATGGGIRTAGHGGLAA